MEGKPENSNSPCTSPSPGFPWLFSSPNLVIFLCSVISSLWPKWLQKFMPRRCLFTKTQHSPGLCCSQSSYWQMICCPSDRTWQWTQEEAKGNEIQITVSSTACWAWGLVGGGEGAHPPSFWWDLGHTFSVPARWATHTMSGKENSEQVAPTWGPGHVKAHAVLFGGPSALYCHFAH